MQQTDFYCKKCKCSTRISYIPCGNSETPVLVGVVIKCHTCKRSMVLKNYTEGRIVTQTGRDGKLFI